MRMSRRIGIYHSRNTGVPEISYSANYTVYADDGSVIDPDDYDSTTDWNIMFKASDTLTFLRLNGARKGIDVFLLGGGANATNQYKHSGSVSSGQEIYAGGNGGGGGYNTTATAVSVSRGTAYSIVVGEAERDSSAFGYTATGATSRVGFTTGGAGGLSNARGEDGETSTKRPFDYAAFGVCGSSGGGGGGYYITYNTMPGNNYGSVIATVVASSASTNGDNSSTANYGGGGGYGTGGTASGQSGMVMIRNKRG